MVEKVESKDGTPIAFERSGSGPAVILVDGALCSRTFGPMPKLAPLLAKHFTVYSYDRRGRGDSGDTAPYEAAREVEDLAALIAVAGGSASLVGLSSGAALAAAAVASGLRVPKLVMYEPPYMVDDGGHHARTDHPSRLRALLADGRRGDAVRYFMRDMVGVPAFFVFLMRWMPMWKQLEAVAHTLPYDAEVMSDWQPPEWLSSVTVPTLAMHGGKTDAKLKKAVKAVAERIPHVTYRVLEGQSHDVKADVLAPVLVEFLA